MNVRKCDSCTEEFPSRILISKIEKDSGELIRVCRECHDKLGVAERNTITEVDLSEFRPKQS